MPQGDDVFEMTFRVTNYSIPTKTTTYHTAEFELPEFPSDVHIIGFEAIISEDTKEHVHHFVIAGSIRKELNLTLCRM